VIHHDSLLALLAEDTATDQDSHHVMLLLNVRPLAFVTQLSSNV
jgi:hypothetical protein